MNFTREDILKILNALLQLGRKDSEFKDANTPLDSDDYIAILLDGINKKVSINNLLSTLGLLKKDDFINVSDRYDEYYIQLSEAITIIANNKRKKGLVITFQDINGTWKIYQFNDEASNFIKTEYWKDLFDFKYPIINTILPDEEDLTLTYPNTEGNSFIKLKDKEYDLENFSGMATKILRKHIVEIDDPELGKIKKNVLYQDDFNKENCIYEIRYDFDLNGGKINIPKGCEFKFNGGRIYNGIINGSILNDTINIDNLMKDEAYIDGALNNALRLKVKNIILSNKTYKVKTRFTSIAHPINIIGNNATLLFDNNFDYQLNVGNYITIFHLTPESDLNVKDLTFNFNLRDKYEEDIAGDTVLFLTRCKNIFVNNIKVVANKQRCNLSVFVCRDLLHFTLNNSKIYLNHESYQGGVLWSTTESIDRVIYNVTNCLIEHDTKDECFNFASANENVNYQVNISNTIFKSNCNRVKGHYFITCSPYSNNNIIINISSCYFTAKGKNYKQLISYGYNTSGNNVIKTYFINNIFDFDVKYGTEELYKGLCKLNGKDDGTISFNSCIFKLKGITNIIGDSLNISSGIYNFNNCVIESDMNVFHSNSRNNSIDNIYKINITNCDVTQKDSILFNTGTSVTNSNFTIESTEKIKILNGISVQNRIIKDNLLQLKNTTINNVYYSNSYIKDIFIYSKDIGYLLNNGIYNIEDLSKDLSITFNSLILPSNTSVQCNINNMKIINLSPNSQGLFARTLNISQYSEILLKNILNLYVASNSLIKPLNIILYASNGVNANLNPTLIDNNNDVNKNGVLFIKDKILGYYYHDNLYNALGVPFNTKFEGSSDEYPYTTNLKIPFIYYDTTLKRYLIVRNNRITDINNNISNIKYQGTTEERPININIGFQYFDNTLSKPIWWTGTNWVDATGLTV